MPSGDTSAFIKMRNASVPTDKTLEANGMSFTRVHVCVCLSVLHSHLVLLKVTFHI